MLAQNLPIGKQARCLAQVQHSDSSSKQYTMEQLNAIAEVHGVVCMSDESSIVRFPYTADSTLRNDVHSALQPSREFKARPTHIVSHLRGVSCVCACAYLIYLTM